MTPSTTKCISTCILCRTELLLYYFVPFEFGLRTEDQVVIEGHLLREVDAQSGKDKIFTLINYVV